MWKEGHNEAPTAEAVSRATTTTKVAYFLGELDSLSDSEPLATRRIKSVPPSWACRCTAEIGATIASISLRPSRELHLWDASCRRPVQRYANQSSTATRPINYTPLSLDLSGQRGERFLNTLLSTIEGQIRAGCDMNLVSIPGFVGPSAMVSRVEDNAEARLGLSANGARGRLAIGDGRRRNMIRRRTSSEAAAKSYRRR